MRKRISEQNVFPDFDLYHEYTKIENLISISKVIGGYNQFGRRLSYPIGTIEEYIDQTCFMNWRLRGTFITLEEMRVGLQIHKELFDRESIDENRVLDFLQYAINCAFRLGETIDGSNLYLYEPNIINVLIENIKLLLVRLNAHIEYDKQAEEVFVVIDNELAAVVSELVPNIAMSISEYRRIDTRGDLTRKAEILCTLAKDLEPLEKELCQSIYKSLVSDTTFLLNKAGIRHSTDTKTGIEEHFSNLDDTQLAQWYDKTFELYLLCRYAYNSIPIMRDIAQVKREYD